MKDIEKLLCDENLVSYEEKINILLHEKDNFVFELENNQEMFAQFIRQLDKDRLVKSEKFILNKDNITRTHVQELNKYGVTKVSLFNDEELDKLINFHDIIGKYLGGDGTKAGYVHINPNPNGHIYPHNVSNKLESIDDGQVRLQSKRINFQIPGIEAILENKQLKNIFNGYYHFNEVRYARQNLEWINPTLINHNPWHIDTVNDALKAMVLLDDVDYETAPMFFAKESQGIKNDAELQVKHALFKRTTTPYYPVHNEVISEHAIYTDYKIERPGKHVGYLSDNIVNNYRDVISEQDRVVKIFEHTYENFICTGKRGDCILFLSNGFHSGNRSISKVRKNAIITVPYDYTTKNKIFSLLGKQNS